MSWGYYCLGEGNVLGCIYLITAMYFFKNSSKMQRGNQNLYIAEEEQHKSQKGTDGQTTIYSCAPEGLVLPAPLATNLDDKS